MRKILHSLRNLPKNLATLRPYAFWVRTWYRINLIPSLQVWLDLDPPHGKDDPYVIHFSALGITLQIGPFMLEIGVQDTN